MTDKFISVTDVFTGETACLWKSEISPVVRVPETLPNEVFGGRQYPPRTRIMTKQNDTIMAVETPEQIRDM